MVTKLLVNVDTPDIRPGLNEALERDVRTLAVDCLELMKRNSEFPIKVDVVPLPAGTAWRWSGLLTAPSNPGGTGWQLKVFVKNQASAQLFIDGLTAGGSGNARDVNIGAYPAAPA